MKKHKLTVNTSFNAFVVALCLLFTTPVNAGIKSGADCNAANLSQALLGIGTSQFGITNNATIPLFIVCSVDFTFTDGLEDVTVEAAFPAGGGSIPCTFRSGTALGTGFFTISFTINAGVDETANADPSSPLRGRDSALSENPAVAPNFPSDGAGPNNTVVCALDPGEGVTAVFF